MSVFGLDYAWSHPSLAAMRSARVKFVCRYLSYDASKNLDRAEANQLSAAGIWIVVVWETTTNRALSGRTGGAADAREAARQAKSCGMPDGRPIYFAADWDASAGQQGKINAYLDGAASVLGRDRVGLYGGYGPIKRAFDAKKITYGWQTYAWSGGRWDSRAQLQQYHNGVNVGGADCDYNRATTADYGQWRIGAVGGDDMPSAEQLWGWDGIPSPRNGTTHKTNPMWKPASHLVETTEGVIRIQQMVAANGAAIAELSKTLAALAADRDQPVDVDALITRIQQAIESVTIHLDVPDEGAAE